MKLVNTQIKHYSQEYIILSATSSLARYTDKVLAVNEENTSGLQTLMMHRQYSVLRSDETY